MDDHLYLENGFLADLYYILDKADYSGPVVLRDRAAQAWDEGFAVGAQSLAEYEYENPYGGDHG